MSDLKGEFLKYYEENEESLLKTLRDPVEGPIWLRGMIEHAAGQLEVHSDLLNKIHTLEAETNKDRAARRIREAEEKIANKHKEEDMYLGHRRTGGHTEIMEHKP